MVLRDGVESEIEASGTVKDDVIVLDAGKQICNDSVVIAGSLEVNESLLTGEAPPSPNPPVPNCSPAHRRFLAAATRA